MPLVQNNSIGVRPNPARSNARHVSRTMLPLILAIIRSNDLKKHLMLQALFMSNQNTEPTLDDRLRGMLLLSAYGDALGSDHEQQQEIHSAPLPDRLPEQTLVADTNPWRYWATTHQLNPPVKGLTTDDTAFKLFLLHPWIQEVQTHESSFDETGFRQFLAKLKTNEVQPTWIRAPRDAQIDNWLDMYQAADVDESSGFFSPRVPIVFGLFMFLELAAFRTDYSTVENYLYFRDITNLDQGYAKSATGFFTAITSNAFASDPADRFCDWLLRESTALCDELLGHNVDTDEVSTILRVVESMTELGKNLRDQTPHEFMLAFEAAVVESAHPPFMNNSFQGEIFDPLRMLAEMYAATAYAEGDPVRAIQPLAFGSGDSDTVCALFGVLLGIWFGENALRQQHANLSADLTIVERLLHETFEVNLNQHVALFMQPRGERES